MDAISTSVSSINLPKLPSKTHHFRHLKPPLLLPNPHGNISASTAIGKPPTWISTKPSSSSYNKFTTTHLSSPSKPTPSPVKTHRNAATGYAAALIDAALCNNSLEEIHKDVKRLLKWLQNNEMLKGVMADPSVEEGVKGRVIKEVSEKAKLRRQVVAMVKMLVAKNKSGMVAQVMEEFEKIYNDLNRSLVVG